MCKDLRISILQENQMVISKLHFAHLCLIDLILSLSSHVNKVAFGSTKGIFCYWKNFPGKRLTLFLVLDQWVL